MSRKKIPHTPTDNRNIFRFLQRSYDESFALLIHARDYFSTDGRHEKSHLPREEQLIYTLAISTITTQLTAIMSWLLLCKAIENGEVSAKEIKDSEFCMPEFKLGVNEHDSCFAVLSKKTRDLLSQSFNLYNRVKRMEGSIREQLLEEV